MELARAFTTRKARLVNDLGDFSKSSPQRSNSARGHRHPDMIRNKISAPIQLVHTTNMLSYNAPDLPRHALRNKASTRSTDSETPSESHSETLSTTESTPPTSPDVSVVDEMEGPKLNHLSTYFVIPGKTPPLPQHDAPAIPQRSPSHTKQNSYDAIARSRSISHMSKDSEHSVSTKASFSFSRSSSTSTRASSTSSMSVGQVQKPVIVAAPAAPAATPSAPVPPPSFQQRAFKEPHQSHPFGHELAQVTELAEEYGARSSTKLDDEDSIYINAKGLVKISAEDYLSEVQNLITSFFPELTRAKTTAPMWI